MDTKSVAAIAGAVYFMKAEEESRRETLMRPAVQVRSSPWAAQGRQSIMRMRELVQRRFVRR